MAVEQSKVTNRFSNLFGTVSVSNARRDVITAKIAARLNDDATDEDIDAAINEQNEIYPFSEIKKNDDRILNEKNNPKKVVPTKVDDKPEPAADEPAWFKAYREAQDAKFAQLEQTNVGKSRKEIASTKLAKYPKEMKEDLLADIDSMNFADDDAFNSFLERKEASFKAIVEKGKLDMFGEDTPPGADATPADKKGKVKEIDADMAAKIAAG